MSVAVSALLLAGGVSSSSAEVTLPATGLAFTGNLASGDYSGCCLGGGSGSFSATSTLCVSTTGPCALGIFGTVVFLPVCGTGSVSVATGGITVPGLPGSGPTTYSSLSLSVTMVAGVGIASGSAIDESTGALATITGPLTWVPETSPLLCVGPQTQISGVLAIQG